jgi:septal ring factor EnvC (AmiA/AmiB activator)
METDVDVTAIDVGTIVALVAMLWKMSQDKAASAEEMGRLKQQVRSLETRASQSDAKFESVDRKLQQLIEAVARIEATLEAQRDFAPRAPAIYRRDN